MLPRIFELFVQVDHASTKAQGGLGIGLTLVKNLVEMHNGTVEARSEGLGKGSEFVVRLPILARTARIRAVVKGGQAGQPPSSSGHRLIVVDDNQDAADSLAMLLRLQGHEVRVAYSGMAAVEMTKTYTPDVVFWTLGCRGWTATNGPPHPGATGLGQGRVGGADRVGTERRPPPHHRSRIQPPSREAPRAEGGGEVLAGLKRRDVR